MDKNMKRPPKMVLLIFLVLVDGGQAGKSATGSAINDLLAKIHQIPDNNPRITQLKESLVTDSDKLKSQLNSIQDTGIIDAVSGAMSTAVDSVEKFTSSDPIEIVSGVLDMVAAFGPLLGQLGGPVGTAIGAAVGAIASVANGILGLFAAGEKSMSDVLKEVLETGLAEERNHQLTSRARGVREQFEISQAFLEGVHLGNSTLNKYEVCSLSSHIPIHLGVEYLGILANELEHNCYQNHNVSKPPNDLLSRGQTCVKLLKLYTDLAVLQDYILVHVIALLEAAGNSENVVKGIEEARKARLNTAKNVLQFLHKPSPEYAVAVSIYRVNNHPEVEKFLNYLKVPAIEDQSYIATDKFFTLNPAGFPQHYIHYYFGSSTKWFGGSTTNATWFYFRQNGTFFTMEAVSIYIRGNKPDLACQNGQLPVVGVLDTSCSTTKTTCGLVRLIKVYLKNGSTTYLITTKQFPQYFVYMWKGSHKQLYTWLGDPGPAGHWSLHKQTKWGVH